MKTRIDEVCESLRDFLANTYGLYLKTQNFHWNVKGPQFYSLHLLFEKQYENLAEAVDEIAERIAILGFHVDATFSAFQDRLRIKESRGELSAHQMIQDLIDAHEKLCTLGRPLVARFQQIHSDVAADMIVERLEFHEKAIWMLKSHLVKQKS
jgi:starvation-inducible DNA-binding protein